MPKDEWRKHNLRAKYGHSRPSDKSPEPKMSSMCDKLKGGVVTGPFVVPRGTKCSLVDIVSDAERRFTTSTELRFDKAAQTDDLMMFVHGESFLWVPKRFVKCSRKKRKS